MFHERCFILPALLLCLVTATSFADSKGWRFFQGEKDPNSEYHKRLPLPFKDDMTSDQNISALKLTPAQRHIANVWGLSESEIKRYVFLMQNRSGHYVKGQSMTPVQVLGMNARDNEERIRYAKKAAMQEFEYLAKYLAFIAAYNQQSIFLKEKLHLPIIRKFDTKPFSPYNYKPVALRKGDKLMLFVGMDTHVRSIVGSLLDELKIKEAKLHVYFVGKKITKKAVSAWAKHQSLPRKLVQSGCVTLNIDAEKFKALHTDKLPVLVLVRDGKSRLVDLSRF